MVTVAALKGALAQRHAPNGKVYATLIIRRNTLRYSPYAGYLHEYVSQQALSA
jgi:hypothetical protein